MWNPLTNWEDPRNHELWNPLGYWEDFCHISVHFNDLKCKATITRYFLNLINKIHD